MHPPVASRKSLVCPKRKSVTFTAVPRHLDFRDLLVRDHGVAHEISRTDFDSNAIIAEYRCHCIDDFKGEPTSVFDQAAVVVGPIIEIADT